MTGHYTNPRDPRLLVECAKIHKDAVPCKVWSPEGVYFTASCATHEEVVGNLVAGGMSQDEYWPQVVSGYRASVRAYIEQTRKHMEAIDQLQQAQQTVLTNDKGDKK